MSSIYEQHDEPKNIIELRKENREQNQRIHKIEKDVESIRVTLIGIDGQNGMRAKLNEMSESIKELHKMPWKLAIQISAILGGLATAALLLYTIFGG